MADAATVSVLIQAKDQASQALGNVKKNVGGLGEAFEKHRMKIGLAATAIGGAIAGIALTSVKSAVEQRKTIDMLDNALQTVGQSYEQNKKQIEDLAAAQQAKTNFGDEESRKSLATLIRVSGDYDTSLKAMVVAQDIAAGSGKALEAVTEAMARGIAGEEAALKAFIPEAVNGMGVTELLAAATAKYAGAAEAAFDPSTQLAQTVSDLQDAIGTSLLGDMDTFLGLADKVVRKLVDWIDANPKLANAIIAVTTVLGGFLLVGGPLLIMLPMLAAGWGMLSLSMLPVTATIVGITAAVYAGILIWQNWDKIVKFFKDNWSDLTKKLMFVAPVIIALIEAVKGIVYVFKNWELIVVKFKIKLQEASLWVQKMALAVGKWTGMSKEGIKASEEQITALENNIAANKEWAEAYEENAAKASEAVEEASRQKVNALETTAHIAQETSKTIVKAEEEKALAAEKSSKRAIDAAVAEMKESANYRQQRIDDFLAVRKAAADSATAQRQSIDDLVASLDPALLRWQEFGGSHKKIMQDIETATGDSIEEIAAQWKIDGVNINNHEELLKAFFKRMGISWFDYTEGIKKASEKLEQELTRQENAYVSYSERMKIKARQLAEDISASAMEDFPEILVDVPVPKTAQQTAVEKTQSTLKEMRESPETAGAMRLAERTLKQHAMMAGVATTSEWATNTFDEKSMAHYKDIARQLSGQMSGTMKEAMEIYAKDPPVEAQAKAMGGFAGGLTLVGERGPELVTLPNGSFVHPNGTGPRGGSNNFIFNGDVYGVEDLRRVVVEAVRDHAISGGFSGVFAEV